MITVDTLTAEINALCEFEQTLPKDERWDFFCEHTAPLMEKRLYLHIEQQSKRRDRWTSTL